MSSFCCRPELKPNRRYQTSLQLYNASVSVEIYTTAKIGYDRQRKLSQDKPKEGEES